MKCPQCGADNKESAKSCRKCGLNLQLAPLWRPTWDWHKKTLAIIYAALIVVFFVMRGLLKPYVRNLPPEITPWLHSGGSSNAPR
jgi:hypothetical protein